MNLQVKNIAHALDSAWERVDPKKSHPPMRYADLPLVVAVVDARGLPLWAPTFFLAGQSIRSRGVTGDTQRTYGESLITWLRYLAEVDSDITSADEEQLQLYRARLMHRADGDRRTVATATANLRVAVAVRFHLWAQHNGAPSPLGQYLHNRDFHDRPLAPRVFYRHPRILSVEEVSQLMMLVRRPYDLAFKWGLCSGMRRFEAQGLSRSVLPKPEQLPFYVDGLAPISILRKGGRHLTVYAPTKLVEETHWYILTDRITPREGHDNQIFIGRGGLPISRQSLSKEFRRCADLIGSDATLHHLRHTFAINVLRILQTSSQNSDSENSLKVLQVLLGHGSMESTQTYLRASEVTSSVVVRALDYLYGATL